MSRYWREFGIGTALAIAVFAVMRGVDIGPYLAAAALLGFGFFVLKNQGFGGRRFEMVGASGRENPGLGVTFEDIGGQEVAKREFLEALDFIKDEARARKLGIRPLRGVLLAGPPGTGKTLMAKAAANYTDAIFLSASGSQFVEMYAGVGAQRVRKLFQQARQSAEKQGKTCAVLFVDEIDVLGSRRGSHPGHMEYDQTLNELLVQMDGIGSTKPGGVRILVVGATNRADLLDPALMRPGRFDRTVKVDLPDKDGREHILRIHAKGKPLAPEVDLPALARETFGFSGAHLESLVNEAAIHALRAGKGEIDAEDFRDAVEKVMMGERLDRKPRRDELRRIAYHEIGHAYLSECVRPGSVSSVTVTSRGQALGYMRQTPADDQYLYTTQELLDQIAVCLAGAAAEERFFVSRSTGSSGDFDTAVELAQKLIFAGLSELGVVSRESLPPKALHEAIGNLIAGQHERVDALLAQAEANLESAAEILLTEEKISGDAFRGLLNPPRSAA
ncbi:MAG TPA: AAA family ATPase [Limnochordia bacterium]|nr:AAA family ATPase [Limnochordia bacterium]